MHCQLHQLFNHVHQSKLQPLGIQFQMLLPARDKYCGKLCRANIWICNSHSFSEPCFRSVPKVASKSLLYSSSCLHLGCWKCESNNEYRNKVESSFQKTISVSATLQLTCASISQVIVFNHATSQRRCSWNDNQPKTAHPLRYFTIISAREVNGFAVQTKHSAPHYFSLPTGYFNVLDATCVTSFVQITDGLRLIGTSTRFVEVHTALVDLDCIDEEDAIDLTTSELNGLVDDVSVRQSGALQSTYMNRTDRRYIARRRSEIIPLCTEILPISVVLCRCCRAGECRPPLKA